MCSTPRLKITLSKFNLRRNLLMLHKTMDFLMDASRCLTKHFLNITFYVKSLCLHRTSQPHPHQLLLGLLAFNQHFLKPPRPFDLPHFPLPPPGAAGATKDSSGTEPPSLSWLPRGGDLERAGCACRQGSAAPPLEAVIDRRCEGPISLASQLPLQGQGWPSQ